MFLTSLQVQSLGHIGGGEPHYIQMLAILNEDGAKGLWMIRHWEALDCQITFYS